MGTLGTNLMFAYAALTPCLRRAYALPGKNAWRNSPKQTHLFPHHSWSDRCVSYPRARARLGAGPGQAWDGSGTRPGRFRDRSGTCPGPVRDFSGTGPGPGRDRGWSRTGPASHDGSGTASGLMWDGSGIGPGRVRDLSGSGTGPVRGWSRTGPGRVMTGPGRVRDGSGTGPGRVGAAPGPVWDGSGAGPGQVRDGSGTGPGPVRDRSGMGPGPVRMTGCCAEKNAVYASMAQDLLMLMDKDDLPNLRNRCTCYGKCIYALLRLCTGCIFQSRKIVHWLMKS